MTKKNMQNSSNIFDESHRQAPMCLNDIDNKLSNDDINIEFVAENQDLIKQYFVTNYVKIREQFLNNPIINVLSYEWETVSVANKDYNIIGGKEIAKSVTCSTKFLTNIIKICLYYVDLKIEQTKKLDNINDLLADAMTDVTSDFRTCYHARDYEYYVIFPISTSSIYITQKSINKSEEIYVYCTSKNDNEEQYIEAAKSIKPPITIKCKNSNYVILEDQILDYIVSLINIIFFIKKQQESSDPQIILHNTQINAKIMRNTIYENQITFLSLFACLATAGIFKLLIDGIPQEQNKFEYIMQNNTIIQ